MSTESIIALLQKNSGLLVAVVLVYSYSGKLEGRIHEMEAKINSYEQLLHDCYLKKGLEAGTLQQGDFPPKQENTSLSPFALLPDRIHIKKEKKNRA